MNRPASVQAGDISRMGLVRECSPSAISQLGCKPATICHSSEWPLDDEWRRKASRCRFYISHDTRRHNPMKPRRAGSIHCLSRLGSLLRSIECRAMSKLDGESDLGSREILYPPSSILHHRLNLLRPLLLILNKPLALNIPAKFEEPSFFLYLGSKFSKICLSRANLYHQTLDRVHDDGAYLTNKMKNGPRGEARIAWNIFGLSYSSSSSSNINQLSSTTRPIIILYSPERVARKLQERPSNLKAR